MDSSVLAWWFCPNDRKLGHGDGRRVVIGTTHTIEGKLVLCKNALHGAICALDALECAGGSILYRIQTGGDIEYKFGSTNFGAHSRTYLAGANATEMLWAFIRRCALDIIRFWDASNAMRQFLYTGDEALRLQSLTEASTRTISTVKVLTLVQEEVTAQMAAQTAIASLAKVVTQISMTRTAEAATAAWAASARAALIWAWVAWTPWMTRMTPTGTTETARMNAKVRYTSWLETDCRALLNLGADE